MSDVSKVHSSVVTWSGGLDTTALLAFLMKERHARVFPIFVNRNQENLTEEKRSVQYYTAQFKRMFTDLFSYPFEVSVPIPANEFRSKYPKKADKFYALRNSDITNSAARYAFILDVPLVTVGALFDDEMFPDISPEYWRIKNTEVALATEKQVAIEAPFQRMRMKKADVVYWCNKHSIAIEKTWTCWRPGPKQCGSCDACLSRKRAFKSAKVKDLTEYLN